MQKPIYEPKARAREYGDLAINIYSGCNHGCVYCYAPRVLHKTRDEFMTAQPRKDIVESVNRQFEREKITGKLIHLCFTCDPYPAAVDTAATREIIKAIKNSGNHVQILTKGGMRATRDFDLLDSGDKFGVTISTSFQYSAEPNAALPSERLLTLQIAKSEGISTWISCEPVLDANSIYQLITNFDFIDLYKIGKLDYMPSEIDWAAFGKKCETLCKEYSRNYYIKEDLRVEMDKTDM
jgi:DNA repair photolyase